jgi:hypothetical protein
MGTARFYRFGNNSLDADMLNLKYDTKIFPAAGMILVLLPACWHFLLIIYIIMKMSVNRA